MADNIFDLNPVSQLTSGYVGQPGERVFYLQARRGAEVLTLLIEKQQLEALAHGIREFLQELHEKFTQLVVAPDADLPTGMELAMPLDPAFRVGQMGLAYDELRDLVALVAQEILVEGRDPESGASARLFATRAQLLALSAHTLEILKQGRPLCGNCGQPIDPKGHFCPKRNGHGRK